MNDDLLDLARRAVASPHWRWMPGMLVMSDPDAVPRPLQMRQPATSALRARVFAVQLGTWYGVWEYDVDDPVWEGEQCDGGDLPGTLPDLSDPATLGCLLALVREAWGKPLLYVEAEAEADSDDDWLVWYVSCGRECRSCLAGMHDTEAAALVAALEAAPTSEER